MRTVLSLAGLLLMLAVVFWLVKTTTTAEIAPKSSASLATPVPVHGSPQEIQQQYKQDLEGAMSSAPRRSADE